MASWEKIAQRIRVPVSRLGVVVVFFLHPTWQSLAVGGAVAGFGATIRLWAAGYIEKGKSLATEGPYAMTRNPLYFGSLIMTLGILIAGRAYWLLLPIGLIYLALYLPAMKREEEELVQGYGDSFLEYSRRVPRFFPRLHSAAAPSTSFLWSRVRRNREHRHLMVLLIAGVLLIIRIYL